MRIGNQGNNLLGTMGTDSSKPSVKKGEANKEHSQVQRLQKEIERTRQELSALSDNDKMSPEQKKKKAEEINKTLEDLTGRLMQAQIDEKKAENDKKLEEAKEAAAQNKTPAQKEREAEEKGMSDHGMQAMLEADGYMEEAKAINHVKVRLESQRNALEGQIAAASSRGEDTSSMVSELKALEGRIGDTTADMLSKYGKANKAMEKALGKDVEEAEEKKKKELEEDEEKMNVEDGRGPEEAPMLLPEERDNKTEKVDVRI